MFSLHVTDLDQWLAYQNTEYLSQDDFHKRLLRQDTPSASMAAGTAFHKLMEDVVNSATRTGVYPELTEAESNGALFYFNTAGLEELELPPAGTATEVRGKALYPEAGVTLLGTADAVNGRVVWDYKTTYRPISDAAHERYSEAMQWRAYLDMFDADRFVYLLFEFEEDKESQNEFYLMDFTRLEMFRYAGMREDIEATVAGLSDYCRRAGLEEALTR